MSAITNLKCDYCGEEQDYAPIVEKPSRFAFAGRIHQMATINSEGRKDNVCLNCLQEEIENLKECY